ncbi:MAG: heat shock protein Hsp20 [Frankiales bacterium]|nr:heat shock protein Hsp20 [Frankiales bacterium]
MTLNLMSQPAARSAGHDRKENATMSTPSRTTLWDPFTALSRMDREFDTLVRRTWGGAPNPTARAGFVPAVELRREDQDVLVVLELPGVDVANDVTIEVDKGKLVISGERRDVREGDEGVLVRELRYGSFRREFALPGGISAENVEATYDAGLLTVRVRNVIQPEPAPVRVPITGSSEPKVLEQQRDQ